MKKVLLFLSLVIIGAGAFVFVRQPNAPVSGVSVTTQNGVTSVPTTIIEPVPVYSKPLGIRIPALNIDAKVEYVGLDKDKRMDVPKEDMDVGWYKLGAKPGEAGSAVFAGHYDTKTGAPAIFYRLGELQKGDEIIVVDEEEKELMFVVTGTQKFKDESFPVSLVFSQSDARRLNLITCDGIYDTSAKNYSDRLVVFTELKEN